MVLCNKALKTFYEGALWPLLTYGAPVWIEAAAKQKQAHAAADAQTD
jgi:hypothetical protein